MCLCFQPSIILLCHYDHQNSIYIVHPGNSKYIPTKHTAEWDVSQTVIIKILANFLCELMKLTFTHLKCTVFVLRENWQKILMTHPTLNRLLSNHMRSRMNILHPNANQMISWRVLELTLLTLSIWFIMFKLEMHWYPTDITDNYLYSKAIF